MDRSGPGGPRGPQPPLVDQERSEPPWTTFQHFPDALVTLLATSQRTGTPEVMRIPRQEIKIASSRPPNNQKKRRLSLCEETSRVETTRA